jgi:hypothetical protein
MQNHFDDEKEIQAAAAAGFLANELALTALIEVVKTLEGFNAERFRNVLSALIPVPETTFEVRQNEILIDKLNAYIKLSGSDKPL